MDGHDRLLAAFLAGDLDMAAAREWDEHLLECEQCWRAVREDRAARQAAELLRGPAPAGLADRVRFAVEVAASAAARPRQPRGGRRLRHGQLAAGGALILGMAVTLVLILLPARHPAVPAPVAAVASYAQTVPPPARQPEPGRRAAPVQVGRPVTLTAGGQQIVMRIWRLGGTEAVVAVSSRPFPMPGGGQGTPGGGMAWSARIGRLSLYCINGRTSELVGAPVPFPLLAGLAARLPLA
jgi:anti-sigma factor RsiW